MRNEGWQQKDGRSMEQVERRQERPGEYEPLLEVDVLG